MVISRKADLRRPIVRLLSRGAVIALVSAAFFHAETFEASAQAGFDPGAPRAAPQTSAPTQQRSRQVRQRRWTTDAPQTTCDISVGYQYDFEGWKGNLVSDDLLGSRAIDNCIVAIREYPSEPRFVYMLGRAYSGQYKRDIALRTLRQIAGIGYPPGDYEYGFNLLQAGSVELGCEYLRRSYQSGFGEYNIWPYSRCDY